MNMNNLESPEEIARQFFHDKDIKLVENKIEDLRKLLLNMVDINDRLQLQFNKLHDEKWADKTLQKMNEELLKIKSDMHRGFPITKEENESINKWIFKHDEEIHGNIHHAHGVSGGGYEYTFYPTALGTIAHCVCTHCKQQAIKEKGFEWYDYCKKQLHGVFEFGDWG